MQGTKKGTVTSLASVFPIEESQKAVKRVQQTIADKQTQLDQLRGFVSDNNNLINLVHKLPEQLSHDIMVPFGKAAFFPGRLIHTNEFLVLLGEGYYAERTSKQTVEILTRRGKALDSQIDSIEATIKDLHAEASFFNATASEALEGLVEIREDYVEEKEEEKEDSHKQESRSGPPKQHAPKSTADNEEYTRLMSRMDELEKEEELAAESGNHSDEDKETTSDTDDIPYQRSIDNNIQNSKDFHQDVQLDKTNNKSPTTEFPKKHDCQENIADQLNFASLAVQSKVQDGKNNDKKVRFIDTGEKLMHPEERIVKATTPSKSDVQHQTSRPSYDSAKAFTGSIIEHAESIKTTSRDQSSTPAQASGSQPSKPVSRFKMQRR